MAPRDLKSQTSNVWAIFARNWGNEGWCSHDQHFLDRERVSFLLPGPTGATAVDAISADPGFVNADKRPGSTEFKANVSGVGLFGPSIVPGGAKITFILGSADRHPLVNGYLHLHWSAPSVPQSEPRVAQAAPPHTQIPEVSATGSRASDVPPDNFPISRIPVEPTKEYQPAKNIQSLTATRKESLDRKNLKLWCKEERKAGRDPDVCHPNSEPNVK